MIRIIALQYLEPYYAATMQAISASDLPVTFADRNGTGNFSRAMNEAAKGIEEEYLWFITDIVFTRQTPFELLRSLTQYNLVAIHPEHNSDHHTHRPNGNVGVELVPYIEFTAPLVRRDWWERIRGLDENHWYWYQDLIFSKAVRELGGMMGVDHANPISHIYRRDCVEHEITKARYKLRQERNVIEQQLLRERYGPNWRKILWCK